MSSNYRTTTVSLWPDVVGRRIGVSSPFNPDFTAEAKVIGGKWDGVSRRWMFPIDKETEVRALCVKIYGVDNGTPRPTRESLERRLAEHLAAIVEIQEQLAKLDPNEAIAP